MEHHQLFLSNNIFDIDSALDRLEENLFTGNDEKSAAAPISIEKFEKQKIDKGEQQQQDQLSSKLCEEKGDKNDNNASKLQTLDDGVKDKEELEVCHSSENEENENIQNSNSMLTSIQDKNSLPIEEVTTERTEAADPAASQAINLTSLSIDDKITTTLAPSDSSSITTSSTSSSSDSEGEEFIPPERRRHDDPNYDDSMNPLISEESINQLEPVLEQKKREEEEVDEEIADDQPVTTDLTLTKTVELTENEPDPEVDPVVNVVEPEQKTVEIEEKHEPKIEITAVKPTILKMEEPREIEISQYNFESTMDDISDAELESLEQELEELVAAAEQSVSKENAIKEPEKFSDAKEGHENETENLISTRKEIEEETAVVAMVEEKSNEIQNVENVDDKAFVEETPNIETETFVEKMETTESEKSVETQNETEGKEKKVEVAEESPENLDDPPSVQESSISEAHEATEPPTDPVLSSSDDSASIRNIPSQSNDEYSMNESNSTGSLTSAPDLGRVPPYWIPDNMTNQCMLCDAKFTAFRRRHHCRACGLLLCSSCCSEKFFLHYMNGDGRICKPCLEQLVKLQQQQQDQPNRARQPNPGNPMEYCSTIPPQQQVNPSNQPLTIMVPTSVLKRGPRSSERKSVIFSDGIRPGTDFEPSSNSPRSSPEKSNRVNIPKLNEKTQSFIPPDKDHDLPPVLLKENDYRYIENNLQLLQQLRQEEMKFAINKNFIVTVKVVTLTCCTSKTVINFATTGLIAVRQDEILILLELNDDMTKLPKEIFVHLNEIYLKAEREGVIITEYGYSQASSNNFLGAFGGFVYVKPSFQCQQSLTLPEHPYLIGLLVHKWEVPWMRLFPLRLILRLGALYRYYPTPILSNVNREPVYAEIGNTVMNLLADFRNFAYTIDIIKGLTIHMESRKTTVSIPKNRYELIMRVLNNSTDHLLALGADFSKQADGHLVCIQNIDAGSSESLSYSTQAIDIQGRDRITTGASLLILSGALKVSSGLKAKCSIVEDGLMVQISSTKMQSIRESLKAMKNVEIACGPIDDEKEVGEVVSIEWTADDCSFNSGVVSPIDGMSFEGKESIRMKIDFTTGASNNTKILRWCEIFVLEMDEASGNFNDDHLNFSKLAEPIARACGSALMPFLDLLAASQLKKIGIRVTLGENIKYLAGANGDMLASSYMNALDNELIGVIHRQTANLGRTDVNLTFELFFYVLNK